MKPSTKNFIEQHIQRIISEFDFENQKTKNPEKCVCYKSGKCHEVENLNCFLCYCPKYNNSIEEGGCKIKSVKLSQAQSNSSKRGQIKGKWFVKGDKKIWDCSDCDYPHQKKIVEKYLRRLFGIN